MQHNCSSIKCLAPWHSLQVRFNGDIAPDCVYVGNYGNILETPLPEILKSDAVSQLKTSIQQDVLPVQCVQCTRKEGTIGHSRRKFFNNVLTPLVHNSKCNYHQSSYDIRFLEINMSNVCNLKCRMCSGVNSTAWIKDDIALSKHSCLSRPVEHNNFGYQNISLTVVDKLFEFPELFKNLQYLNIKGGEPYLEPANKKILEKLINLNLAKNITLDISTNGTVIDHEFDELALQFKETKWHISLEGTGKLYEYIRGGDNFSFEQFENNLQNFNKFSRVIFAGTIMTYNICHLANIESWYEGIKQLNYELFLNNVVTTPAYLNPAILPESILKDTPISHKENTKELKNFILYTQELDKLRNTSIHQVCPELSSLFS